MKATKRIVACFIIALGLVTAPICVDAKIKARAEKEVGTKELLQRLFNAGISMSPGKAQGQIERQRALDAIILSRIFSKDGIIDADAVSQLLWTRASAKYASVAEIYRMIIERSPASPDDPLVASWLTIVRSTSFRVVDTLYDTPSELGAARLALSAMDDALLKLGSDGLTPAHAYLLSRLAAIRAFSAYRDPVPLIEAVMERGKSTPLEDRTLATLASAYVNMGLPAYAVQASRGVTSNDPAIKEQGALVQYAAGVSRALFRCADPELRIDDYDDRSLKLLGMLTISDLGGESLEENFFKATGKLPSNGDESDEFDFKKYCKRKRPEVRFADWKGLFGGSSQSQIFDNPDVPVNIKGNSLPQLAADADSLSALVRALDPGDDRKIDYETITTILSGEKFVRAILKASPDLKVSPDFKGAVPKRLIAETARKIGGY